MRDQQGDREDEAAGDVLGEQTAKQGALVVGEWTSPLPRGKGEQDHVLDEGVRVARETGTTAAADVRRAVTVARTAVRWPAVKAIRARPTGRRGQAVHFRPAAEPTTSPAATPAPARLRPGPGSEAGNRPGPPT
ncbi:hypothetical protein GCM10023084_73410 [Streptomyces lacrimifluminis]|uniref:Uncharacterized protein n=1 Tax=Streptomyces lacrimifluminis TaxID=1500077 RepID=A0A917P6F9_9ACTN|nr:hypothetical protein GCM10012282_71490 [Streptomyces lacrimifluminis]